MNIFRRDTVSGLFYYIICAFSAQCKIFSAFARLWQGIQFFDEAVCDLHISRIILEKKCINSCRIRHWRGVEALFCGDIAQKCLKTAGISQEYGPFGAI